MKICPKNVSVVGLKKIPYPLVNVMEAYGYPLVNGGLMVVNGGLMVFDGDLSSGQRLQFANWKITMFKFGKSTISMGHFQ